MNISAVVARLHGSQGVVSHVEIRKLAGYPEAPEVATPAELARWQRGYQGLVHQVREEMLARHGEGLRSVWAQGYERVSAVRWVSAQESTMYELVRRRASDIRAAASSAKPHVSSQVAAAHSDAVVRAGQLEAVAATQQAVAVAESRWGKRPATPLWSELQAKELDNE